MSASFLASVLIFSVGGAISLFRLVNGEAITGIKLTDYSVAGMIFANALFFLYIELFSETDTQEIERLRQVHGIQWWLRVVNHANLTLTWLWLSFGLIYCLASLFLFYFLILVWDAIVFRSKAYREQEKPGELSLVNHDLIGFGTLFVIAAAFIHLKYFDPDLIFNGRPKNLQDFSKVNTLNSIMFACMTIFFANALWVMNKTKVDMNKLLSRESRV